MRSSSPTRPAACASARRPLAPARGFGAELPVGTALDTAPRQDQAHHRRPQRRHADGNLRWRRGPGAPAAPRARPRRPSPARRQLRRLQARARAGRAGRRRGRLPQTARAPPVGQRQRRPLPHLRRHSHATVRGTRWLTEDRCGGTLTRVTEGAVVVRDLARAAGTSWCARATPTSPTAAPAHRRR